MRGMIRNFSKLVLRECAVMTIDYGKINNGLALQCIVTSAKTDVGQLFTVYMYNNLI